MPLTARAPTSKTGTAAIYGHPQSAQQPAGKRGARHPKERSVHTLLGRVQFRHGKRPGSAGPAAETVIVQNRSRQLLHSQTSTRNNKPKPLPDCAEPHRRVFAFCHCGLALANEARGTRAEQRNHDCQQRQEHDEGPVKHPNTTVRAASVKARRTTGQGERAHMRTWFSIDSG